jgi:type II secretory pathway pseudopilin PulG
MPTGDRRSTGTYAAQGYAMVALLVGLSVMAVAATVALPVWKQMAQREKEAELVFRGEQYARAIALYQRRNGPGTLPADVDVLLKGRFLRRAYRDPITGEDFMLVRQSGQEGTGAATGGIVGVASRSQAQSIRVYNNASSYNEWQFIYVPRSATPADADTPDTGDSGRGRSSDTGQQSPTPPRGGRGGQNNAG